MEHILISVWPFTIVVDSRFIFVRLTVFMDWISLTKHVKFKIYPATVGGYITVLFEYACKIYHRAIVGYDSTGSAQIFQGAIGVYITHRR